jgi:hypothetical protein
MTQEQLTTLIQGNTNDLVNALQVSSYKLPAWTELKKEYEPTLHKIMTDYTLYPVKRGSAGGDDFKRTPLGLQKLAVNRISQSMFSTPVERKYKYDETNEQERTAVAILEQIYKTENFIDSENMERAKKLHASCQIVTVWATIDTPTTIEDTAATKTLIHKTYSEIDGYNIYPQIDAMGTLVVLSIGYTTADGTTRMDVYTPKQILNLIKKDNWEIETSKPTLFMPLVYTNMDTPVWGGQDGTLLVEQLEEMESFQGLYVKRNALPTFTIDWGELNGSTQNTATEKDNDARRLIEIGKGGVMKDVTWAGAGESVKDRYTRIRNSYFEQVQMPDLSFATLINSNTSADNKEFMFTDAHQKARDLGGEWERFFYLELRLVKDFMKIMYPSLAKALASISIRSVIKPYSVRTKKETAEYVALAGDNMSLKTKIGILGEVDDISAEMELIQDEQGTVANQL